MRSAALDRQLLWVSLGLMLFGLLTLYSAGQTDVPTRAAGVWYRQFVWFGIGVVRRAGSSSTCRCGCWSGWRRRCTASAWCCSSSCWSSVPGQARPQSSKSWLAIGGHQIGQPAELAKLAAVLMLARYLSSRKEPPRSLRDLLVPAAIVGVPFLLVLKQPDLGSAIVFIGIALRDAVLGRGASAAARSAWRRPG